jgi:hypothetical protein
MVQRSRTNRSGDASEAFRADQGIGGNLKRVVPVATPPKYRDALERSGNPKDTREIMVDGKSGAPGLRLRPRTPFKNLERATGGEPACPLV